MHNRSHRHTTSVAQQDGQRTDSTWTGGGKRRQRGEPHDVLNGIIDREKDASRVCFLIQCQERMLQVEHPAQENIASLAPLSIADEGGSHLAKRRMALGGQTVRPSYAGRP